MKQCVICETVYDIEESNALNKELFCSFPCQENFYKDSDEVVD